MSYELYRNFPERRCLDYPSCWSEILPVKYNQAGISARSAKGWNFPLECEQCRFSAKPVARVRDVSAQPGTLGMRHTKSTANIKFFFCSFIFIYIYYHYYYYYYWLTSRISPKGWDCSESNFQLIKKKTEKLLKTAQALYSVYAEVFYLRSMSVAKMVIRHYPIKLTSSYKASWMFGLVRKCADWRINIYTAMVPGPTPSNLPATTWKPTSSEMSLSVSLQRSA